MSNTNNEPVVSIDPAAFAAAEQEAAAPKNDIGTYTHVFKTPFFCTIGTEQRSFDQLTFDFNKLTGRDSLAIENELQALGKPVIVAEMSGEYLIRMAARACTEKIGADDLAMAPLADYNKIRSRARSFLLRSGS
ncbi:MAG: hypothetical protein IKB82_00440 [Clostridia bacterium]|nr:hypothetical protein [Clostridia bacterium]